MLSATKLIRENYMLFYGIKQHMEVSIMKKVVGICIDANNIGQISWWNNHGSKLVREGERKDYYDKTTGRRLFTIAEG